MTQQRAWTGLGFNPAPGDEAVVSGLGTGLRSVAGRLIDVHSTLTKIAAGQGEWTGEAAKAFADHLGKLPGYLQDASDSITLAYQELDKWHASLTANQPRAVALDDQATAARQALADAQAGHRTAAAAPDLGLAGQQFPDQASRDAAQARYDTAKAQLDTAAAKVQSASDTLDHYVGQGHDLAGAHEKDARYTAGKLKAAADSKAPPEPGLWHRIGHWLNQHGGDLLTVAAAVAGVAAIFFPGMAIVAIGLSMAAAAAHARQYGLSGLWPPNAANIGNDLTLAGDLLGAIPGVGVAAKGLQVGTKAADGVRAAEGGMAAVKVGVKTTASEIRLGARGIDPATPLISKPTEWAAMKLGASKLTAMDISDGVQATTTLALTAPTAYSLTVNNPGPGLTSGVNYTTGAGNLFGGTGLAGGIKKQHVQGTAGTLLTLGNMIGVGVWAFG
ncbi:hypothetical protein [Kitasatospora viridis]|uniref:WXG100 family type VII secretion target n=1 Tax=Kitasatospora viridis TaxID=281105 RepID=A0A561T6A3_9ACTN|nr:hypothetical protein [Kitasatospora viridis]TWF82645.1 hypothetical protein FHX73_14127 [Kitasatospora viridis]